MSTKPDSGTGEHPTADSPAPSAESSQSPGPDDSAPSAGPDDSAPSAAPDDASGAEVELAVAVDDTASATELADDDSDIAIEVEAPDPAPDPFAELQAKFDELDAAYAELHAKQKETYERLLRATADLDNFRKRSRRDVENGRVEARSKTLVEMLPVVDNLERAVAHADGSSDAKGIADGVNLVLRQFAQALERCGVTPVESVGKPFDPNIHEAVSQQESAEHPAGTVIAELQRGYRIGDRLLRPTLAVVSTATAVAEPEPEADPPKPNGHDTSAPSVPGGEAAASEAEADAAAEATVDATDDPPDSAADDGGDTDGPDSED